jgi:hypothetical protein
MPAMSGSNRTQDILDSERLADWRLLGILADRPMGRLENLLLEILADRPIGLGDYKYWPIGRLEN